MKKYFSFCCFTLLLVLKGSGQSVAPKIQWFADAKLGIFIHAGIYAVDGVDESWSFFNKKISYADYMKQLKGFTLSNFHPEALAGLIKSSGARYAVITTKHHDGVAMYDSRFSKLNIVKATPAKQDMIAPLFAALRKFNIKCGAYYSLIDWSSPLYPGFIKDSTRYKLQNDYLRWQQFQQFFQSQIREIGDKFNPDLWWFDGDWEHSAEEWQAEKVRHIILSKNPNAIINGRLQGYGDYATPEQNFPVTKPPFNWWELCLTINNNWGYQPTDLNWKTPYEVITIFVDAVANGGNLLLDIGPKEDGSIPAEEVDLLKALGSWNERNGEAVFSTIAGLPAGHFYGPSTLSKDSTTLFLFVHGPSSGEIMVKGLVNKIKEITVLGSNTPIKHKVVGKISWSAVPGLVYIGLPASSLDKYVTVLKLQLDGPVKVYRGQGGL
jgi:alpha-L-fucosidase